MARFAVLQSFEPGDIVLEYPIASVRQRIIARTLERLKRSPGRHTMRQILRAVTYAFSDFAAAESIFKGIANIDEGPVDEHN